MPTFRKLDPGDVRIGRERAALAARRPYIDAIRSYDAGRIELASSDRPQTVKRLLQAASKDAGVRVRSSWEDEQRLVLFWKKIGAN